jgi:hypothetical protein
VLLAAALGSGCSERAAEAPELSKERIGRKVDALLELTTYEYIYRDIIYIGEEARFLGIKHLDKRLLFSVDFRITAGVDLDNGDVRVKPLAGGGVRIELPEPSVLTADAREDSIRQYFVKEFGGRVSRLEYYDRIDEHKREAVESAVADGILDRAGENARTILTNTLEGLGIERVFVVFLPQAGGSEEPGGEDVSGGSEEPGGEDVSGGSEEPGGEDVSSGSEEPGGEDVSGGTDEGEET